MQKFLIRKITYESMKLSSRLIIHGHEEEPTCSKKNMMALSFL